MYELRNKEMLFLFHVSLYLGFDGFKMDSWTDRTNLFDHKSKYYWKYRVLIGR